jgi:hypothetical protein
MMNVRYPELRPDRNAEASLDRGGGTDRSGACQPMGSKEKASMTRREASLTRRHAWHI